MTFPHGFTGDPATYAAVCTYCDNRMADAGVGVRFADSETPAGILDGMNAVFALANAPTPPESLQLFRNGLKLAAGQDFTLSGSTITFLQVPHGGDFLEANYRY